MSFPCGFQLLKEIPPDGDKFATMVEVGPGSGRLLEPKSFKVLSSTLLSFLTAFSFFFLNLWQHILSTEENWNSWKNEGCPSFVKERLVSCAAVPFLCERELQKMTVCLSCFLRNRTVDDKPKRPSRKRQAPEDFLGKGPDRKIFMGKYVDQRGGLNH